MNHVSSQDLGGIVGTKHLNELDLPQVCLVGAHVNMRKCRLRRLYAHACVRFLICKRVRAYAYACMRPCAYESTLSCVHACTFHSFSS